MICCYKEMNNKLIKFNLSQRKSDNIPEIKSGDIVRVHRKIKEGSKERIQVFEGIIIAIKGKQSSSPMITVRKVSNGVGVELVIPMYSSDVDKIELVKRAGVRRSKLYYLRDKSAKSMRLKYKDMADFAKVTEEKKENIIEEKAETETKKESSAEKENKKEDRKDKTGKDNGEKDDKKKEK